MFVSATLGLVVMVGTFLVLEWLDHGVVNAAHGAGDHPLFLGVRNKYLACALGSVAAGLALLAVLPFPRDE